MVLVGKFARPSVFPFAKCSLNLQEQSGTGKPRHIYLRFTCGAQCPHLTTVCAVNKTSQCNLRVYSCWCTCGFPLCSTVKWDCPWPSNRCPRGTNSMGGG